MDIALFTNGQKSIAGTSEGNYSLFESIILYQDPTLFAPRFLSLIQNRLNISVIKEIDKVIISVAGLIDSERNILKLSHALNDLSRIKLYDGFNFNEALEANFTKDKIFLLNDALATAIGVSRSFSDLPLPCMILSIDQGVGVSFINASNNIINVEWGTDRIAEMGKSVWGALGRESIYNLLFANIIHIDHEYTEALIKTIDYLTHKYEQDNSKVKSVVVLGERSSYVDEKMLAHNLENFNTKVVYDELRRKDIILKGCLSYPEYLKNQKNKVVKIKYFSGQELIYDFEEFIKCSQHFVSVKPISNPDNYYKIIYSDGSVKTITMGDLTDITELESYRF